ncbi:RagB/SusD family nutrient uptake outer membrane protein [Bacteroides sp. 51]|uniref:RagB/SusD family nutrient uptake outer membrane protein n=1 Tax=Bacteroides sp. 51 TaxID=2302938 RepID=UPI0013D0090E|nr:RagB/SusD family nutrient uptake outer membrane protein [Bacteroides sp. 51]NDV84024.1 RagB/SusD family nutrient uptake outer membrane protein [Bacteroides sp. 51]
MNRYIFKKALIACCFSILFAACSDSFLDIQPKDKPGDDNFLMDLSSAQQLVVASFTPLVTEVQMYAKRFGIICDGLSDDSGLRINGNEFVQILDWNITPDMSYVGDWWKFSYQSINASNYAIKNIPTLKNKGYTDADLNVYIAEARFMRAFNYMFLVTFYGDVPLILEPLSSFDQYSQPRSATSTVYTQIIEDFQFAKEHLSKDGAGYSGMPTRAAGAAYLAKAYLYQKDYAKAETEARDAIRIAEEDGYYLIDDYASIFSIDNEENPELLFYLSYERNSGLWEQDFCVERNARDVPTELKYIQGGEGWGYCLPSRSLYDAYEPNDPRRDYTLFSEETTFGVYTPSKPLTLDFHSYDSNGTPITTPITYNTGDDVLYDYTWSPTGLNVKKLTEDLNGLTNVRFAGLDWPLMRMADLYLFLAETLAEQGKEEALVWVNKVRSRASVNMPAKTTADGSLIDIVRQERRVELGMEGQRIFDLLRWNAIKTTFGDGKQVKLHFYSDYLPATSSDKYKTVSGLSKYPTDHILFPIPQYEMDQNKNIIENNPGY